jgi:lipopolysaccharide transport system ATP-binding protein
MPKNEPDDKELKNFYTQMSPGKYLLDKTMGKYIPKPVLRGVIVNMYPVIEVKGVSKEYRLGAIGSGSFLRDFQSWTAHVFKREDPNSKIDEYVPDGEFTALDNVSFAISRGEAVGIIGANGAGKSTLLKILSRITLPSKGEAVLRGKVSSMLEIGTGFHPDLTGRENIYMNGAILGMRRSEISGKINKIIEFSEISKFIDTPVKRYSSGMYVKLAFAVSAHLNSEIIIIDEVLAVGDAKFIRKSADKMREIISNDNRTILCVSHDMTTIKRICSRCMVLDKGRLIFDGDVIEAISIYSGQ